MSQPSEMPPRHEFVSAGPPPSAVVQCGRAASARRRPAAGSPIPTAGSPVPTSACLQVVSRRYAGSDQAGPVTRWLDAVPLAADRTVLSVGTVAGTGPAASELAHRLRQESRAGALLGLPPGRVLTRLRGLLGIGDGSAVGTSLYLLHDGASQSLALANAGHVPAVIVSPDGATALIGAPTGPALGQWSAGSRTTTLPFVPGASVVLYAHPPRCHTGRPTDAALLAEIAETRLFSRGAASLGRVCETLARRLGSACTEHETIVTIAQATCGAGSDHPTRWFAGEPACASAARAFTLQTMDEWELTERANRAAVIVGELAANAIQHAGTPFEVMLHRAPRVITLEVADSGPHLPRRHIDGEHEYGAGGLLIVETLADCWGTRRTGDGKTVWAELRLAPS